LVVEHGTKPASRQGLQEFDLEGVDSNSWPNSIRPRLSIKNAAVMYPAASKGAVSIFMFQSSAKRRANSSARFMSRFWLDLRRQPETYTP
jgi:hypothetical protein